MHFAFKRPRMPTPSARLPAESRREAAETGESSQNKRFRTEDRPSEDRHETETAQSTAETDDSSDEGRQIFSHM